MLEFRSCVEKLSPHVFGMRKFKNTFWDSDKFSHNFDRLVSRGARTQLKICN